MKYQHIRTLSDYLEQYEELQSPSDFDLHDFASWLLANTEKTNNGASVIPEQAQNIYKQNTDVQISILIGRMSKYARVYTKKILSHTGLSGLDDYSFLATLMFNASMTKSELIHHNLMESTTSGADIIKRLLQKGYIIAEDDSVDKRSKRVKITSFGRQLMTEVFKEMGIASTLIAGNLSQAEKAQLIKYLQKLDSLHQHIYNQDRKEDLDSIIKKHLFHPKN